MITINVSILNAQGSNEFGLKQNKNDAKTAQREMRKVQRQAGRKHPRLILVCDHGKLALLILHLGFRPLSDLTTSIRSLHSTPHANLWVHDELPKHERPALVAWKRLVELLRYLM